MVSKHYNDAVDATVGARIRLKRVMLGMSQTALANHLNVSFQQVQKYEKGTNRVSSSRLWEIALLFDEPVSYFFAEAVGSSKTASEVQEETDLLFAFLRSKEGIQFNQAFASIKDTKVRQQIIELVKSLGQPVDIQQNQK